MTGETKHVYAINNKEPSTKDTDKDIDFQQLGKNNAVETPMCCVSEKSESGVDKGTQLNSREKEHHNQREAVIRPQQAGKIDFKSLHNRQKNSSDATWTNSKGSPLSPTGKNRGKDKTKRSGKGDRTQHQLYRLSITNTRPNPTIGIAYPQQKVTPPKKVDITRGPVSGSYRFHVPSLPEREAELQQEDLSFNRCFQESSPSLTSSNYTSQAAPASRAHHSLKLQPQSGNSHETPSSNGQLHYLEFQPNGNSWHSPEKTFQGSSSYGVSSQKLCPFSEGNKTDSHYLGTMPFQYPFQSLQESTGNSFCNDGNNQDFVDISLLGNQVAHNILKFQSSSREGPDDPQNNVSYNNILPDSRTYSLPSQQSTFLHAQQGSPHLPNPPCYPGRNEHSTDLNGAISSTGAINSSGAIEQTQSTFQENQPVFNSSEFSLHDNSVLTSANNRQQPSKDFSPNQRLLSPGNTLRRNIPQTSLSQVHFPSKVYNSVNTGSVPFDKSISRIPQTWDGGSKDFSTLDQNSVPYSGNQLPFQCQPNIDQRQPLKNSRMPWQQIHFTSAMPNQNRVELSRQIGNQKATYPLGGSEWQGSNLSQKIPPGYHNKKHLIVEGIATQRTDAGRQSYGSSNGILYESTTEPNTQLCDSRNKNILFGMSQPIQQSPSSRNMSNHLVSLPTSSLVVGSPPNGSPLPSPLTNPVSGSTCSSLSPLSSSPVNPNSDEKQKTIALTASPYFQQQCHSENKSFHPNDTLSSVSLMYHTQESMKNFNYIAEASKEEQLFKNVQENQYQKQTSVTGKGCLETYENEPPPPPPYSSHHLLASSLSSANLDQLDVLLTCKQCDQNYSNLSSFLEHRQYCSLNSTPQNEIKDTLRIPEVRKQSIDSLKTSSTIPGFTIQKGPVELQPHMIGLNKAVDYLLDSDSKEESKEDLIKVNVFHSLTSSSLPLSACDTLEMDEAKLDSLITEALNVLEFQVDNPEIDSSFIDVFVDDDISSAKVPGCEQSYKTKESIDTKKKQKDEDEKLSEHTQTSNINEENYEASFSLNNKYSIMKVSEHQHLEVKTSLLEKGNNGINEIMPKIPEDCKFKKTDKQNLSRSESTNVKLNKSDPDFDIKNTYFHDDHRETIIAASLDFSSNENHKPRRPCMKDGKKKKPHNGSWSKELIHKIVQQKNKLHKLHVKSNKNLEFSLVTERLFPPTKSHPYGEYDYISDSENESDMSSLHEKRITNDRLKYNFNRDNQGRNGRTKGRESTWRMGEATRFQLKNRDFTNSKKEISNRMRRRSSQSSTSSDQSTSFSSETGSSPKSTERTDSENEQETVLRNKSLSGSAQNIAERNLIKLSYNESSSETLIPQKTVLKGTKRFGSAKFLLGSSKSNNSIHLGEKENTEQNIVNKYSNESNTRKNVDTHILKEFTEENDNVSTYDKEISNSTLSQDPFQPEITLNADIGSQQLHSFRNNPLEYKEKQLSSSLCVVGECNPREHLNYDNGGVEYLKEGMCNEHKHFTMPMGCYNGDSKENMSQVKNQDPYTNESQTFTDHKELSSIFGSDLFPKSHSMASPEIVQIYHSQSNSNSSSFDHKCPDNTSCTTNTVENKTPSTLSFDSSSIFVELPMTDFEAPMYSNVSNAKESYVSFTCSNDQQSKTSHFDQQYPQFLQGKGWDMIEDAPHLISNNIAPFQVIENENSEKFAERIQGLSSQVTLTGTITDYNTSYINNISEDELEIKRLVTELESQLQTSKLQNETQSQVCSKYQINKDLPKSCVSFPDLAVNSNETCTKDLYFKDNQDSLSCKDPKVAEIVTDSKVCQPLVNVDSSCEDSKSPWTCSVAFDAFTSNIQKQASTLDSFDSKENESQYQKELDNVHLSEDFNSLKSNKSPSIMIDSCLQNVSSQSENQTFSENNTKRDSLIKIESLLSKTLEHKDIDENSSQQNNSANVFNKKEHCECTFDDPPTLEPFQSVSEFSSDCKLQDNQASVSNTTLHDETLCCPDFSSEMQVTKTLECNENCSDLTRKDGSSNSTICRELQNNDLQDKRDQILLDMPVLEKEETAFTEKSPVVQESAANPLQQLQLFVARTAKNNEEEMLIPCFPLLLSSSVHADPQPDIEGESLYISDSTFPALKETTENNINTMELEGKADKHTVNSEYLVSQDNKDTPSALQYESISNVQQNEHLENGCSALDAMTNDHIHLLSHNNASDCLLLEQINTDDQIENVVESDGSKLGLEMKNHNKSTYLTNLFDNQDFSIASQNTMTMSSAMKNCPSAELNKRCQLPCSLTIGIETLSKDTAIIEPQTHHKEPPEFTSAENQKQNFCILQERDFFLTKDEISKETTTFDAKSDSSLFADSSAHFVINDKHQKPLHENKNATDPTAHVQLSFGLFHHLPLEESVHNQTMLVTTTINKEDPVCNSREKCHVEAECPVSKSDKKLLRRPGGCAFLNEERYGSSSLEISQNQETKLDESVSDSADDNISQCFYSELTCPDYKEQSENSVTDVILGCQSLPANGGYQIYPATENQTYPTLQSDLFSQSIESITESSLSCQQGTSLKSNWNNKDHIIPISNEYPSENRNTSLVCDLIDMTHPEFVDLCQHQASETGKEGQASESSMITETDSMTGDSDRTCSNDMDSVINGVLRILDCDKSKEILESIGISSRTSPIKEKKPVGLSLTCDVCFVSFKSKPGLTRHKAVKHNTKKEGHFILQKDGKGSDSILNGKSERALPASERELDNTSTKKTSNPLITQSFSTEMFKNPTTDLLNHESNLHSQNLSDEEQRPLPAKHKGEKRSKVQYDGGTGSGVVCKRNLNNNVKKRRIKMASSDCTESQVPSDDILNILKANILKAIGHSNSFTTPKENSVCTQHSNNDALQQDSSDECSVIGIHTSKSIGAEAEISKTLEIEEKWSTNFNEVVENMVNNVSELAQIKRDSSDEHKGYVNIPEDIHSIDHLVPAKDISPSNEILIKEKTLEHAIEESIKQHFNDSETVQVANGLFESKDIETELHNLFDDDNTFSQLFPRDDNFIRRKCTRVYGKRNKRQTPPFEADIVDSSAQVKNFACRYENISVDSNLISSRCSTGNPEIGELHAEYDDLNPMKEGIVVDDNKILSLVNIHEPTLIRENKEEHGKEVSFGDNVYKSPNDSGESLVKMSSVMNESELEDVTYDDSNLPEFPTIDMKMLSAKFDMSELSFFSACGDDSDHSDMDTSNIAQKADQQKRNAKNRNDNKRHARNRSNTAIKTKDKQYKCKVCFQWFLTLGELDFHKLTHNPSPPPTCYMCVQRKFSSREQLRDHLKDKHAKNKAGLWICGMCLKEISDVWMYNEHLREHATQFARKGQAQKTVMGIPGCFAEDSMVRTFLSTFIYRTPNKSPKTSEPKDKSPENKRQDQKVHKEEDNVVEKEPESAIQNVPTTHVHVKQSVSPPLENTQKNDFIHKNPAIHPHCKDPSRDCHHCGKQFPKPFKLQRHLVVHSLQKMYLCHKCPKSYQEVYELRNHLNNEHQLTGEPEIKHTTLYACELCADVMHVIKKSFICSTCNYTFSKKEQYDRHMEKHLIGGNMTFKFRGVMRPGASGKDIKEKKKEHSMDKNIPPSKKLKTSHDKLSDTSCMNVKHNSNEQQSVEHVNPSSKVYDIEVQKNIENESTVTIKMEDTTMDASELQRGSSDTQGLPCNIELSPSLCSKSELKSDMDENVQTENVYSMDTEIVSPCLIATEDDVKALTQDEEASQLMEPPILYPINPKHASTAQNPFLYNEEEEVADVPEMGSPQVTADYVLCQLISKETKELFDSNRVVSPTKKYSRELCCPKNEPTEDANTLKALLLDDVATSPVQLKDKSVSSDVNSLKESKGLKKNRLASQLNTRVGCHEQTVASEDVVKPSVQKMKATPDICSLMRDNNACTLKETMGGHHKLAKKELTAYVAKHNNTDSSKSVEKSSANVPPKHHTKKYKEYKLSDHKVSTSYQENMSAEGKRKKTKLLGTGKTDSTSSLKKTDWTNNISAFSGAKDEPLCTRQYSKSYTVGASSQVKKTVLDTHNQRKNNPRTSNGEYKYKKAILTKPLHSFTPKNSPLCLSSSSYKHRQGYSTKSTEPSNYRTAESQNNLLSQLFGQKLTSFKIPLRKDITE
ncbi:zinc finger protein 469 [Bombina bombina]|uniref:zinc finger protein 469 n=1 Tax=Bombina bombina TaxID=8345 RepID=UPI00235AAAE0|nr:zinc finger protein 469 [Bombina bombina]XP_053557239.1 zinc finger protein 469 [Bombina bombina]XP_053557247.1 zinc finger protein 469 [Bombina bombina]